MKTEFEICVMCNEKINNNPIIIKGESYCNSCAMEKIKKDKENAKK